MDGWPLTYETRKYANEWQAWLTGAIAILPKPSTWAERWQFLSATLPDTNTFSEQDILDEIHVVRQQRDA
ncbi:hypothetical protein GCM10028818_54600 [Spirosoma horti]